jgi:hypothetical protein
MRRNIKSQKKKYKCKRITTLKQLELLKELSLEKFYWKRNKNVRRRDFAVFYVGLGKMGLKKTNCIKTGWVSEDHDKTVICNFVPCN